MADQVDNPGVIAPPPLIALGALLIGLALDWLVPLFVLGTLLGPWTRGFVGGVVLTAGVALAMAGRERFREAGTNVEPWNPAVRVVTAGVYQYVRNPMYVGLMLMVGGLGVALASDWALVMIVPLALTLRNGVVLHEEFYLERKFGDEYRRFKARVPRWGIW